MGLSMFMIDYETKEATWKVKLLAESKEDALGYLKKEVGDKSEGYRIVNMDQRDEVHAITTQVLENIRGPKIEAEVITETKIICPWCEEDKYGSLHALKMHIVKAHTGKTAKK